MMMFLMPASRPFRFFRSVCYLYHTPPRRYDNDEDDDDKDEEQQEGMEKGKARGLMKHHQRPRPTQPHHPLSRRRRRRRRHHRHRRRAHSSISSPLPYFFPAGPTVLPRRPVVLVCCPRTRTPQ